MKRSDFTKYLGVFVLAVLIIAVYKTFDSIGIIFDALKNVFVLLAPIFTAFVIAFVLYPLCAKIEGFFVKSKFNFVKNHRRGISVFIIYILFVLVIAAFISILLPAIIQSITEFVSQLPSILKNVQKFLKDFRIAGYRIDIFDKISVSSLLASFKFDDVQIYISHVTSASKSVISFFVSMIMSVYILIDRTGLMSTAKKIGRLILPEKGRPFITRYINRTFSIMYKYLYCQIADAFIVFALSFVILLAMRVKYAAVLALFLGLFNLIPYFGAITACTVTALLTAFTSSLSKGVWVAVLLVILQQTDANFIQPRLVRGALQVKPFWVLCGISVGGSLFGILGIILAIPVMALFKTFFDDYYDYVEIKRQNADSAESSQ